MVHGRFWHSAQLWRCLLCSQNLEPSQSRQIWRRLPCSQNAEPPQSRQLWRCLSCSQKLEPPQSRHCWRCLSCGHFLRSRFTGCGAGGGGGVAGTARSAGCPRTIDFSCWPFRCWSARPRQLQAHCRLPSARCDSIVKKSRSSRRASGRRAAAGELCGRSCLFPTCELGAARRGASRAL